eukprot:349951-Chlamydomonas_euryale.AAC.2
MAARWSAFDASASSASLPAGRGVLPPPGAMAHAQPDAVAQREAAEAQRHAALLQAQQQRAAAAQWSAGGAAAPGGMARPATPPWPGLPVQHPQPPQQQQLQPQHHHHQPPPPPQQQPFPDHQQPQHRNASTPMRAAFEELQVLHTHARQATLRVRSAPVLPLLDAVHSVWQKYLSSRFLHLAHALCMSPRTPA